MPRLLHFFWFNYQKRQGDTNIYQNSNYEIQKWAEKHLANKYAVHSTSCITQGRVTVSQEDILLGHLSWDPHAHQAEKRGRSQRNWMLDNRLSPDDLGHPNSYVLTPWVPVFPPEWTDNMPFHESQLGQARLIFAICGPIWHEQTLALNDDSIQSKVKSKLVRLNMGVNMDALKIRKSKFNPMGRRKLIHVSNLESYKGFDLLLDSTQGIAIPSIGSRATAAIQRGTTEIEKYGKRYAINNLGPIDNSNDTQINELVNAHDFYLHTSSMDAQATTILEFASRGLIPIVTPESGFESEHALYLTRYASRNREIIANALNLPEDDLIYRSERIKSQIEKEHSWPKFFATIAENIDRTCQG